MNNVVQNISIADIVPSDFQIQQDSNELKELAASIKKFGILEPILVRPLNGKYEIIIGNKRYVAAKMIGLSSVPALIKNVDDEVFKQYRMITKKEQRRSNEQKNDISQSSSNSPKKNSMLTSRESEKEIVKSDIFYNIAEKNEDVISLHELSKKEYERNDEKMNNGQFNSNVMNNNLGGVTNQNIGTEQEPTFGGRFFPSLEDEPTNMNLNNMNRMSNEQVNSAILPNQAPNNLIDLTDVSGEKEPIMAGNLNNQIPSLSKDVPNLGMEFNQNTNNQPTMNQFNIPSAIEIPNLVSQPENNIPNNFSNMNPANSNQINIPVMNDNNMNLNMGVDYQNVTPVQNIPQFDMSQNIAPTQFGQAPEMSQAPSLDVIQNDFSGNINMPTQSIPQEIPNFNQDFNPSFNPGIPSEAPQTMDSSVMDMQQFPQKEVLPVINTLKNLASSLETFGYKINISEEDLPNSHKLTIEVEK